MPIKVAIVEDDPITLDVFRNFFRQNASMTIVGAFKNGETALAAFQSVQPDIVLLDIGLPGISGIECIKQIKALNNSSKILIITGLAHEYYLAEALKYGADGFLLKPLFPHEVVSAIQYMISGGTPVDGEMLRSVTESKSDIQPPEISIELSQREKDVMEYVVAGKCNKEIAELVHLKVATVESYLKAIYLKLRAKNRADAVSRWLRIKSSQN